MSELITKILTVFEKHLEVIRGINSDSLVARCKVGKEVHAIEMDKSADLLSSGEAKRLDAMLTATGYASSERAKCKAWYLRGPAEGKLEGNFLSWSAAYELFSQMKDWHPVKRNAVILALGPVEVADKVTKELVTDLLSVVQSGHGVTETGKISDPEYSYTVDGNMALNGALEAKKARLLMEKEETDKRKAEAELARQAAVEAQKAEAEAEAEAEAAKAAEAAQNHPDTVKVAKIAAILQQGNLDAILILEDALTLISRVVSIVEA